jgi:phenol/toluene 2-monooxygenase (NADH) P0/A0
MINAKDRSKVRNIDNYDSDRLREYRKTVNIFGIRKGVFLEFEFTVGHEELTIELVMPYAAFKEFCETNHVSKIDYVAELKSEFDKMSAGGLPKLFNHELHGETDEKSKITQDLDARDNIVKLGDF